MVDEIIAEIKDKEGINKPFNVFEYNYVMFINILSESAYGKRYKCLLNRISINFFKIKPIFLDTKIQKIQSLSCLSTTFRIFKQK
jgi:hypothetical protein